MVTMSMQFSQKRYLFLRSLLDTSQAMSLYDYALNLIGKIQWISDEQVAGTPALYGEPRMEELLVSLLPGLKRQAA